MNQDLSSEEKKKQVQDYFSRTAASYVTSPSHRSGKDLPKLIDLGEWNKQQLALDVATGGGHTALAVAPHVAHVTVSDLTPIMLDTARAFLQEQGVTNADFRVADAEQLPFEDASFDRVTCRIAPHHFPNIRQAVREIARVLKPQGLFLLIDNITSSDPEVDKFHNTIEKWRDSSHVRSYTKEEWVQFFIEARLRIEHQETLFKTQPYDSWTERAQMPANELAKMTHYILNGSEQAKKELQIEDDGQGHLKSFAIQYILLKGRKQG
ncbi:MAG TPA: methyltransferase domain-containing protein [Dictyobacter sp.]|jgi:ubiquinone/menaquinone biosynthesis C-methylase UbiE|nr:methyltransferase domain-containing protein [Dictyobacter sp.]